MGLFWALAASIQAAFAIATSRTAASGVSPNAEQYFKSGILAMYPSFSVKNVNVVVFCDSLF
jgi:hypothetical protein